MIDKFRKILIQLNNLIVSLRCIKAGNEEVLLLIPRCLQNSKCQARIIEDIRNCQECGRCPASELFDISRRFNVRLVVVTGGMLARQIVRELKVKAIVAVACEKELVSGIFSSFPRAVMGIVNKRPYGPCYQTSVDINQVEKALKMFFRP